MSYTLTHSMPAEDIACWTAETEREYPTLLCGELRAGRVRTTLLRPSERGVHVTPSRSRCTRKPLAGIEPAMGLV